MDHFCPWTNNSIGAKNQKQFFLFLIYTDLASFYVYFYLSIRLVCPHFLVN
jgi:palmitoyltransferase